ncbi:MAG: hypothetical protein RLZZ558_29 [Planctomycetota bacterium]
MSLTLSDDRPVPPSQAIRQRAIQDGRGPRAPWLASAISGLLALTLLSLASAPLGSHARSWLRASIGASAADTGWPSAWSVILPAVVAAALLLAASVGGQWMAQASWLRLGHSRRRTRPALPARFRAVVAGWLLAAVAVTAGTLVATPWLPAVRGLPMRDPGQALWAAASFVGTVALAGLLVMLAMGMLQLRAAMREFDRTLHRTHAEARSDAREESGGLGARPGRWRRGR